MQILILQNMLDAILKSSRKKKRYTVVGLDTKLHAIYTQPNR